MKSRLHRQNPPTRVVKISFNSFDCKFPDPFLVSEGGLCVDAISHRRISHRRISHLPPQVPIIHLVMTIHQIYNMLRFLADENFNNQIVRGILRRKSDVDIVRFQDVGLLEADDPTVLEWAAQNVWC